MPSRTTTADALETGEIALGMLETTNGNLADRDLVQRNDDRRLQPAENHRAALVAGDHAGLHT
jgi:glycine betaine/choline ABC-type transport system substrate-binding protein